MASGSNGHGFAASVAAIAVMAVAGCATPTPPAPPPPVATTAPAERPLAIRPAPPKPVDLRWAFTAAAATCTASASGPGGALQIQAESGQPLVISARFTPAARAVPPQARPARLGFSGAAGKLNLMGTWQNSAFTSKQKLDEHGVATILGLLGGGTAIISAGSLQLGSARLPAANTEGNAWVQCPKTLMAGLSSD